MKIFSIIAGILSLALLSGCASTADRVACEERDWYEAGRRDGAQGQTLDRLQGYKNECSAQNEWETMYTNGRNAGLVEYCLPENAYELGRSGISYYYVCPSTMESGFLKGYRRGQQAREIEVKNKEIDAQIQTLNERLLAANTTDFERREIDEELVQLKKKRAQIQRDLATVTK